MPTVTITKLRMQDLFEEIGRGVVLHDCKLCGAFARKREQHLKWHNTLNKVLWELKEGKENVSVR